MNWFLHEEGFLGDLVKLNVVLTHVSPGGCGRGQKMEPVWPLPPQDLCTVEAITKHSLASLALVLDNAVKEHGLI